MSEFIRFIGWIFVVIGVAIVGVCVLFYYIARCIIRLRNCSGGSLHVKFNCNGENCKINIAG